MLHALRVIALAVLLSSRPMRLRRIFVKFSGLVVIAICHLRFLKVQLPARNNTPLSEPFRKVTKWCGECLQKVPSNDRHRDAVLSRVRDPRASVLGERAVTEVGPHAAPKEQQRDT
jgi:hypothetical protein